MNNLKGCYSHNTDDWKTPALLYEKFMQAGFIDPCPYQSKEDNLNKIYHAKLFINPPYSKLKEWTEFIFRNRHNEVFLLIPARTDTKYFHKLLELKPHIIFIKGRLHFNDSGSAPFPSIMLHFNNQIFPTYSKGEYDFTK